MLSPRLLGGTDLFVLELWRTYPTRLRAEGLAVAEELIRQRARPLVVSPLALGGESGVPWYWDLESEDSLEAPCGGLLRMPPKRWVAASAWVLSRCGSRQRVRRADSGEDHDGVLDRAGSSGVRVAAAAAGVVRE